MKRCNKNKQHGVVLVFSLLILLLITLVGVNMVQQNRLQFMMAANSQMQTTSFIDTEDVLELAEYFIARQRYKVWPFPKPIPNPVGATYACNKTASGKFDQIKPHILSADELKATGVLWGAGKGLGLSTDIIARSHPVVEITQTACLDFLSEERECETDPPYSKGDSPSAWDTNEQYCNNGNQAQCPTEIYTLNIQLTDPSGSQHVVQSRFAVRCDS